MTTSACPSSSAALATSAAKSAVTSVPLNGAVRAIAVFAGSAMPAAVERADAAAWTATADCTRAMAASRVAPSASSRVRWAAWSA